MNIRETKKTDDEAIWAILKPVFRAGDTYSIDSDISRQDALAYWCGKAHSTYVAEDEKGKILGTYYLRRNQGGGGRHVCNCGYVTSASARGKGIARAMLAHSLETAKAQGYRAMQYNFVVATNVRAIETWKRAGFDVVGTLPEAFCHPENGWVNALVMYRKL